MDERERDDGWKPWHSQPVRLRKIDRYERRANICPVCHTTKALRTGACLCDPEG